MRKHQWLQFVAGGLMIAVLIGCATQPQPSPPPISASATLRAQPSATRVIPSTATPELVSSSAEPSPPAVSTRQWTAAPIAPAQTFTKEKAMPSGIPTPAPSDSGLQPFVQQAKEDLAKRLAVNINQIELIEARPVVWPDKSLGCPQPDMEYTQVQVDGLLIRLSVSGQIYEYHSGGNRSPFLCQ